MAQNTAIDDIEAHLRKLVQTINPNECAAYFKAAGYASV
jgi:hypothetical protein